MALTKEDYLEPQDLLEFTCLIFNLLGIHQSSLLHFCLLELECLSYAHICIFFSRSVFVFLVLEAHG